MQEEYVKQIHDILQSYEFITIALVFGSYANNKQNNFSDIDIAIESLEPLNILEFGEIVSRLECNLDTRVDLVLLNKLHYENPLLAYNIYINHKVVFIKDKKLYDKFKIDALHRYMDFKYVIDEQNKAFKQRVSNGNIAKTKTA